MVLSLRAEFTEPDPTVVAWSKFLDRFSESMTKFADQFVEDMKQARLKSDPKHDRKVLICGYMEEEDCYCVATEIMESKYDLDDVVVELEEENGYQSKLQSQQDEDLFVEKAGDHELLAKLEDSSKPIHQLCEQVIHDKVTSLRYTDFSFPSLSTNAVVETICANEEGFLVADNMFDKSPERHGSNIELKPKPPDGNLTREVIQDEDDCLAKISESIIPIVHNEDTLKDASKESSPIEADPSTKECSKNTTIHDIHPNIVENKMAQIASCCDGDPQCDKDCVVLEEMPKRDVVTQNVLIVGYTQDDDCLCILANQNQPMYNDSGGKTKDTQIIDWSKDEVVLRLNNSSAQEPYESMGDEDVIKIFRINDIVNASCDDEIIKVLLCVGSSVAGIYMYSRKLATGKCAWSGVKLDAFDFGNAGQKSMILSIMVFVRSLDEWVEKKTIEFVKILDNFFTVLLSEKWSSAKLGVTCLLARHAGANLGMLEIGEHVHSYIRILLEGLNTTACFRVIGMAIIMSSWTQNYGDSSKSKDLLTKFRGAALAIDFNEKIFVAVRFIASRHGVNIVAAVRFGIRLVRKWEICIEAQGENLAEIIALFKSLRLVFDSGGIPGGATGAYSRSHYSGYKGVT